MVPAADVPFARDCLVEGDQMPFPDRATAGRALAKVIAEQGPADASVVAVPRGGVPVGLEVARELGVPLDVVVVGKLRAPGRSDFAVGALGEDGTCVVSEILTSILGIGTSELAYLKSGAREDLASRALRIRWRFPALPVEDRTVVVVDDGLVTGATAVVAARIIRAQGASKIVVAVPSATPDGVQSVGAEVEDVIALEELDPSRVSGMCFGPGAPDDDEVMRLLELGRSSGPPPGRSQDLDRLPLDHRPAAAPHGARAPGRRVG